MFQVFVLDTPVRKPTFFPVNGIGNARTTYSLQGDSERNTLMRKSRYLRNA